MAVKYSVQASSQDAAFLSALAAHWKLSATAVASKDDEPSVNGAIGLAAVAIALLEASPAALAAGWLGASAADRATVLNWTLFAVNQVRAAEQNAALRTALFVDLNAALRERTYIATSSISLADVLLHFTLWPLVSALDHVGYRQVPHLTRWFDNVQRTLNVRPILALQLNQFYIAQSLPVLRLPRVQAVAPTATPTPAAAASSSRQAK
ncbi:hypothetical protein CAOG_00426 [Capsaspora owczarzaki ATCC 30864]|uniref:GST C-terminal domain-containing protein n=1 Tax=Capsaspora owczarzaki (strain ATCC 30864) TaxID=595528 RepID=A0A0D2X0D1_CAPO3|nr:hypothetical protein CAOG_00426 [Capsaspora owczarzaki ATCC 30864]KJE88848.1 hypothetical protein CAOG_000426 [Capsaspora owczarzaki ATCC 30864]KJE88849.1 hypothetical protein, variant [Capsaspora owczarzaki ATCC 30864]|eukprot:XP_004365297.1 hypothetical protein CAOG_00426 [Capsaspora owczarzaki ATCC 30864]